MQLLLANAKLMHTHTALQPKGTPAFQDLSNAIAMEMALRDISALERDLGCSRKLAAEVWRYYQDFGHAEKMPALAAYNGHAYKHLGVGDFTETDWNFAEQHLWITCFLYGLLRPMDGVVPYRMEHNVRLQMADGRAVHALWKEPLTDLLIARVKADDGILLHLSTAEYEQLFDWQRVCSSVQVVQPLFYVRSAGKLKVQAVWAKACRGAMARYVIKHQLTSPEQLRDFAYEGFVWAPHLGEAAFPHFVRG